MNSKPQQQAPEAPPPYPYAPLGTSSAATVPPAAQAPVVTQVIVSAPTMPFGARPVNVTCPHCQANVVTALRYEGGTLMLLLVLALLFTFWCAVCVPCCIDECKDVHHVCPNCNRVIGTYKRM